MHFGVVLQTNPPVSRVLDLARRAEAHGFSHVWTFDSHVLWQEPFVTLRFPKLFNLRRDPFEKAEITSNTYYDWLIDRAYLLVPAQAYVGNFLGTFKKYPPRQKAASFSLDEVMLKLQEGGGTH